MLVTLTSDDSCYGVVTPKMESDARELLSEKPEPAILLVNNVVLQSCQNIRTEFMIKSEYTLAINITLVGGTTLAKLAADINRDGCNACEA